jgi:ribulose-5-phosphate 4-epimerase/fuculose-1-phosphate aldolase
MRVMIDDGYIKFDCLWTKTPPLEDAVIEELNRWRQPLFDAGLVGHCEDTGVGYGNISVRTGQHGRFIITGTQTGHLADLTGAHFARVTDFDTRNNRVTCQGPVKPSSESLTHAAIYELDPAIQAIAHIHSDDLWQELRDKIPTSDSEAAFGTAEMAEEFRRLYHDTDFASRELAVMAGHEGGLISIGHDIAAAAGRCLDIQDTARVSSTTLLRRLRPGSRET